MLGLVKSCIGTKFTSQFGDLIAVSILHTSARFSYFLFVGLDFILACGYFLKPSINRHNPFSVT